MNRRKIGILGLMAMMGIFWGCTLVEAATETVVAYRAYDVNKGPIDETTIFGTTYNAVYIVATCTGKTGGIVTGTATIDDPRATYTFGLRDDGVAPDIRANDGVYTAAPFSISRTVDAADLLVCNGKSFSVAVDIDGLGDPGSVTLGAEYIAPGFLISPFVTKTPIPLYGTTSICFTAKDDIQNGTWTYSISINDRILSGSSTGTYTGQTAIDMIWDGRDKNGDVFTSGNYSISVKIEDNAGNFFVKTTSIMIDDTFPLIESIIISPSPYLSTSTTVTISFTGSDNADIWAYDLSYKGQLLYGTGASGTRTTKQGISFICDGRYGTGTQLGEGQHEIVLNLWDSVGNIISEGVFITIDNTAPVIENLQFSNNLASSENPLTVSFTGVESTGQWTYMITIGGQITQGIQGTLPFGTISSNNKLITFIWPATDKNGLPFADGDYIVEITLTDMAGNVCKATGSVKVDGTSPELTNLSISNPHVPPYGSPSTISFVGSDNLGTWTYSISIDDRLLGSDGTPSSTGILVSAGTISFVWNGKDVNGTYFLSGSNTITVQLKDMAGNTIIGTVPVIIDAVAPKITLVNDNTSGLTQYLGEEIEFQMTTDGPATATIMLTTSEIQSAKEIITGQAPASFRLNDTGWDQYGIGSGRVAGKVEVFVVNKNNGNGTRSTFTISDYSTPYDLFSAINVTAFGISTYGSVTYNPTTDKAVFRAAPEYEIGLREYCDVAYKTPFFTQLKLPVVSVNLTAYTPTEYKGSFVVPATEAIGTWTVYGFAMNGAGTTSMKGGTITMDGSQPIPITKTKIIGLRVEPSPSKQFFNSSLKRMHVQMAVATLDKELGEDEFTIDSGNTEFTLYAPGIKINDQVIIWNDYIRDENNKVVFDHGHVWTKQATSNGTITFSDTDLYFGSATGTYSTAVFKMKNFHIAIGTFTTKGIASFDVGSVKQGIPLHDDGDTITHWDTKQRDGIFSNTYLVPNEIDIRNVPIVGHFMDGRGYQVPNDGYPFNDENASPFVLSARNNTDFSNDIKVNINTIPIKIRLLMAEDATFNPLEGKDCYIKYNLEGATADVRITIKKASGETVKDLWRGWVMPGDNVTSWDGMDYQGKMVEDGKYYYHIVATDEAGNKSEDKGLIVISFVQMVLEDLVVTVPKAVPGKGIEYISISAVVSLDGTPKQLKNLNFETAHSDSVFARPHALFDIAIYDRNNNLVQKIGPDVIDFTGESYDSDPFPNGKPNYLILPTDERNWLRNSGTNTLADMGDGNKDNDWEILVPFDKVNPADTDERHYKSKFTITMAYYLSSPFNEGSYYVKGLAKLVSADWKFAAYDTTTGNEMWHCAPFYGHYGVHSQSKEQGFEVRETKLPTGMDNIAPGVYESYPSGGVDVSPFEIKNEIWVKVEDNSNGSGVDFRSESSYLRLFDANKMEVAGIATNNATDKLYLIIDKGLYPNGLEKPGAYTIEVVVRDMANNVSKVSRSFTVLDRLPPEIENISPKEGSVYYEGFGLTLSATISELQRGKSGVNWGSSRITLSKDGTEINIQNYKQMSNIDQEINVNYRILSYELPWDFLKQGTYTMNVLAWDTSGNPASKEISFRVIRGIEIFFDHPEFGLFPTLAFKPNTEMFFNGSSTIVSTQTISLNRATITATAIAGYTLFGKPVSVLIGTRSAYGATFSQSVQLTIYYTGTELNLLPVGKSEDVLVLYGYDGGKWNLVPGAKKGMYTIKQNEPLYSTYTLAYITPQKWTVMSSNGSEWGNLKSKDWMELVGTITTSTGIPIPNGSITIGIITNYPSPATGYKVLSPVVAFDFKGDKVIKFNNLVAIWIYYTEPLPFDAKEGELTVFGCDDNNTWIKIAGSLSIGSNYISFNTQQTYKLYAIMYPTREAAEEGKETIEQNIWCYPNPAKGGKVNFRYYLSENDVEITVKIYTLLGDLVWEGSRIEGLAGIHDRDFVWNCQNSSGEPVASGVYIYRLTMKPKSGSAAKTVTKKLIVIQ